MALAEHLICINHAKQLYYIRLFDLAAHLPGLLLGISCSRTNARSPVTVSGTADSDRALRAPRCQAARIERAAWSAGGRPSRPPTARLGPPVRPACKRGTCRSPHPQAMARLGLCLPAVQRPPDWRPWSAPAPTAPYASALASRRPNRRRLPRWAAGSSPSLTTPLRLRRERDRFYLWHPRNHPQKLQRPVPSCSAVPGSRRSALWRASRPLPPPSACLRSSTAKGRPRSSGAKLWPRSSCVRADRLPFSACHCFRAVLSG